jgi:hypothetical protein
MTSRSKAFLLISLSLFMANSASAFTLNGGSQLLGWATDELVFLVNATDCPIPENELLASIDKALAVWNTVPTSRLRLVRGGTTTLTPAEAMAGSAADGTPTPVIICDTDFSNSIGTDTDNIPAAATPGATGIQVDYGYILLNAESGKAANIANLSRTVLEIVLAHEIGHILGLGHTANSNALMYYNASYKDFLSLAQDDMDGITYLYPREEPGGGGKAFGCATVAVSGQASKNNHNGPGNGGAAAETGMLFIIFAATTWIFRRNLNIRTA